MVTKGKYDMYNINGERENDKGLGGRFVLFYVGFDCDDVAVHEKKLRENSSLFDDAFNLPEDDFLPFLKRALGDEVTLNSHNRAIWLKHSPFDTENMNILVNWLYTTSLPSNMKFRDFHLLYLIADKFQMAAFLTQLVEHIQKIHKDTNKCFTPKQIIKIYRHRLVGGGQLWQYCAKHVTGYLVQGNVTYEWVKAFKKVCLKAPDLGKEFSQMMLKSAEAILSLAKAILLEPRSKKKVVQASAKSTAKKVKKVAFIADHTKKSAPRRSANKKEKQQPSIGTASDANHQARKLSKGIVIKHGH